MLPEKWRFTVENKSGVDIAAGDATIIGKLWTIDPSSGLAYVAQTTFFQNAGIIGNDASEAGAIQTNTTDKGYGGHFHFRVQAGAGAAGDVIAYLEVVDDGNIGLLIEDGWPVGTMALTNLAIHQGQIEI